MGGSLHTCVGPSTRQASRCHSEAAQVAEVLPALSGAGPASSAAAAATVSFFLTRRRGGAHALAAISGRGARKGRVATVRVTEVTRSEMRPVSDSGEIRLKHSSRFFKKL